jgi:dihydroneopterin triphosphate diphosphatase
LIFPFRWRDGVIEFAVFCRADMADCWQGLAGGAEDDESAEQAARREMTEEAGIPTDAPLVRLDATASVPKCEFAGHEAWGPDLYVVPERTFGVRIDADQALTLSHEHTEQRWLSYEQAAALVKWDSNRIALWELNERLRNQRHGPGSRDGSAR